MSLYAEDLEAGLDLFRELLDGRPDLRQELEASRRDFFRGRVGEEPVAVRRHLEWFLFERLGGPAHELGVERLLPAWRELAGAELSESDSVYQTSRAGIFRVVGVEPGRGAWVEDLVGAGEYALEEPDASRQLMQGDLLVGRLFALGEGKHLISPAARLIRSSALAIAIEHDLERLRAERGQRVLRISQLELERMFFDALPAASAPASGGGADPVREVRRVLADGGVAPADAEELVAALASAPLDPAALLPGAGDPLGEVLDLLAFDSGVDLTRARAALLVAWAHLSRSRSAPKPAERVEPDEDVRAALERFAAARSSGADLNGCFDELERDLGLAAEDDDEEPEERPELPSVVGALIEEFLWQRGIEGAPADAPEYDILRRLEEFSGQAGVIEELGGTQLVGFAALWIPDRVDFAIPATAGAVARAVRDFAGWLAEEHALELGPGTVDALAGLEHELPRIVAVNALLRGRAAKSGDARGETWGEIAAAETSGGFRLLEAGGGQPELTVGPELAALLRPGDWLRLELDRSGRSRPVRCFPPQAAVLLRSQQAARA